VNRDSAFVALKREFQATLPGRARLLQELAARVPPDEAGLVFHCHKLAGVAGSYGFKLITEICDLLEARIPKRGSKDPAVVEGLGLVAELLETCALADQEPAAAGVDPRLARLRG
jgi:HPt (histidine-containing phosphotransfer) domain-containing protein